MSTEVVKSPEVSVMEKQGFGGNQWQTQSGSTLEAILADMQGTLGVGSIGEALQQAAFLMCCDIIAQDISKAGLQLMRRIDSKTAEVVEAKEHPVAKYLALEPNRRHTWLEVIEMSVYWYAFLTNSYLYIKRNRFGDVVELIPVVSGRVSDLANLNSQEIFYEITAATWQEQILLGFTHKRVPERDVIHVRGRMLDGFSGYSTLLAGQKTLKIGAAIDDYREGLFTEDGQIRGVFRKSDSAPMSDTAFARLKSQLGALMRRFTKKSDPIVLEEGIDFKEIASNPEEAELTKQLEASIVGICRLLRIPPHKAFHLVNVKYENMEVLEKSYMGDTLEPILQRFEQRIGRALLSDEERLEYFVSFNRKKLELQDPKVLIEKVKGLLGSGAITVDEARAEYGYNPIPGGNTRTIPANMMVLDDKNEIVVTPPTQQPSADPKKTLRLAVNND